VNFDASGAREGTIEVTTDTAAKRGLAVSEDRWQSWLYSGGHAVLCSSKVHCWTYIHVVSQTKLGIESLILSGRVATTTPKPHLNLNIMIRALAALLWYTFP
jgi:hypothetical protein